MGMHLLLETLVSTIKIIVVFVVLTTHTVIATRPASPTMELDDEQPPGQTWHDVRWNV